jgi:hypothetical protein
MMELLEIEQKCVLRNSHGDCERNCAECDLVQDDGELLQMYTDVIALMKEREPVGIEIEGGGSTWWHVCGECHGAVDSCDLYCRHCGSLLANVKKNGRKEDRKEVTETQG